jgi:hypothetical protein
MVVVNATGDIIATGPHPDDEPGEGNDPPASYGYSALEGQEIHEVEVEDGASLEDLLRLHDTHRLQIENGTARLYER